MRIIFVGSVLSSYLTLEKLLGLGCGPVGVVTRNSPGINADYVDISGLAGASGIPCHFTSDVNGRETIDWIAEKKPDVILCVGWSSLLGKRLLGIPPLGVVGFHPAALPQNRGRHPLIWALALGLNRTASTFFFMDEGADSGDILSQIPVDIDYADDAYSLYRKVMRNALTQVEAFIPQLRNNTYARQPQDHSLANYWRKRGKPDGRIDFRCSSRVIYNLIRALNRPYAGAHIEVGGIEAKVWRVREIDDAPRNLEPGKVLSVNREGFVVKCGEGSVMVLEHELRGQVSVGDYL